MSIRDENPIEIGMQGYHTFLSSRHVLYTLRDFWLNAS